MGLRDWMRRLTESKRDRQASVVSEARRGLSDHEIRREERIATRLKATIRRNDPPVMLVALPDQPDQCARVDVDNPHEAVFAPPYR